MKSLVFGLPVIREPIMSQRQETHSTPVMNGVRSSRTPGSNAESMPVSLPSRPDNQDREQTRRKTLCGWLVHNQTRFNRHEMKPPECPGYQISGPFGRLLQLKTPGQSRADPAARARRRHTGS